MLILFDRYHLQDVIIGKIYFLLVRIKIKHMELAIIRRESTGSGGSTFSLICFSLLYITLFLFLCVKDSPIIIINVSMSFNESNECLISGNSSYNESETVTKFEIMDGAPARGFDYFLFECFEVL